MNAYVVYHTDRLKKGAGVAIYVKSKFHIWVVNVEIAKRLL